MKRFRKFIVRARRATQEAIERWDNNATPDIDLGITLYC